MSTDGPLLRVSTTPTSGDDVEWKVFF